MFIAFKQQGGKRKQDKESLIDKRQRDKKENNIIKILKMAVEWMLWYMVENTSLKVSPLPGNCLHPIAHPRLLASVLKRP